MENLLGTILAFAGPIFYQYQKKEDYIIPSEPFLEEIFGFGIDNGKKLALQGYLLCNGKAFSPQDPQLKSLYQVIGKCWGGARAGAPLDYFRIPALEGLFLRGVSNKTDFDPERAFRTKINSHDEISGTGNMVGSFQRDETKQELHTISKIEGAASIHFNYNNTEQSYKLIQSGQENLIIGNSADTRPKNAYVNWIIKASENPIDIGTLKILEI